MTEINIFLVMFTSFVFGYVTSSWINRRLQIKMINERCRKCIYFNQVLGVCDVDCACTDGDDYYEELEDD